MNTTSSPVQVSFDLETAGTSPNAMILSIGAVKFREDGVILDKFYRVIDVTARTSCGTIDAATVVWWMRQSQEARDAIFGGDVERVPLVNALVEFSEWLGFDDSLPDGEYPNVCLWQRGNMDATWLTSAYEGLGLNVPFGWWQVNDQRTLCRVTNTKNPRSTNALHHNALSDALHQAGEITDALAKLNRS